MKHTLIALLLLLTSNSALAQSFDGGKLVNFIHKTSALTFIKVEDTMINPANCISNFWYAISTTDAAHDDYVSMAMTALASGKTLGIYVSNTGCESGYPLVTGFILNR